MNNLSWLIYLAEVSGSLGGLTTTVTIIGFFSTLAIVAAGFIWQSEANAYVHDKKNAVGYPSFPVVYARIVLPITVVCSLLTVFIPSKSTVMLIAASEMSQVVIETPQAQRVFNTLEQMLNSFVEKQPSK